MGTVSYTHLDVYKRQLLGHGVRVRGDAAHALQEVERHPLAGKKHARIAAHGPQQLAGCDLIAIRNKRFERRCGVEQREGALKHIQTRNDARRLCDELNLDVYKRQSRDLGTTRPMSEAIESSRPFIT